MNKKHILLLTTVLAISLQMTYSQIGGRGTYKFLQLTTPPKIAALGGNQITIIDRYGAIKHGDISFAGNNPALLDSSMLRQISTSYINYFAGINYGYLGYGLMQNKYGCFAVGMQYVNYGEFVKADETGLKTGTFRAAEYAPNLIWSRKIDSLITVGATLKPILSDLESYISVGIAADLGVTYHNPLQQFTAAVVLKNIGTQIKPYNKGHYEPIAFDLQAGISKKLAHAPFRFSLLAHHLTKWNMLYDDPDYKDSKLLNFGETPTEKSGVMKTADNALRHVVVGMELLLTESFYACAGYNHQRKQEMAMENLPGFYGFSYGFGFRTSKYQFSFGRASYHLAGGSSHFSVNINLSEFKR